MKSNARKADSKRQYIARRQKRVRELYIREGLQPREIAAKLVADGTIETSDESLESAARLVRSDVAALRVELDVDRSEDAKPALLGNAIDALERQLAFLRKERDRQVMIADGEPDENGDEAEITTNLVGKGGIPIPFSQPKWPAGTRQKASKDAAILCEKISALEVLLTERRTEIKPAAKGERPADGDSSIYRVVTSGKSMSDLVTENATGSDSGEFN